MKIAMICSSFFPVIDGVTIAIYQRLKQLSLMGHQVIVLCPEYAASQDIYPDYEQYMGEFLPGIKVISLPSNQAAFLEFERDLTWSSNQIIMQELVKFQPDIIHVDEAERLSLCLFRLPGVKFAQQYKIPCVSWFHTNYIEYLDDYFKLPFNGNIIIKKLLGLLFAKIYNAYDLTLVSSKITAQKLSKQGIKNLAYAELLGCDLEQFKQVTKDENFWTEKYYISNIETKIKLIFIGRLTPDKGWQFTIQALSQLPPQILNQIAIIIAGDGDLKTTIEHNLKQLTAHVYLLGRIKPQDIPQLLTNGDIYLTNSQKETRGLTAIEAAAAGIPAIAPRAGGLIDTIEDGVTGFLYQPDNQTEFINQLTLLIDDANLRQQMGHQAKLLARKYSWQKTVNNLVTIWQQAIAQS